MMENPGPEIGRNGKREREQDGWKKYLLYDMDYYIYMAYRQGSRGPRSGEGSEVPGRMESEKWTMGMEE
jgi:hypothetical protein